MPKDSDSVARELTALWGTAELPINAGVLHVVATWAQGDDMRAIRISPQSPKSPTDFFLLNLARARADAILTTGQILRDEPELEYTLPPDWRAGLLAWRAEALGRSQPPQLVVLSSGRDLDLDHPAFGGWARPSVMTSGDGVRRLASAAEARGITLLQLGAEGVRGALATLRARAARTICVEAGPSTARAMYAGRLAVDELLWSTFQEPTLEERHRGGVVFERSTVAAQMGAPVACCERYEPSGRWSFSRFVKR